MDCLEAQGLVSQAMDREPVDARALAQAKEHCRGCAECAVFVRTQLAMKRAPLPEVPAGLPDRVMVAIRAEANAAAEAAEAQAAFAPAEKPALEPRVVTLAPPKPRTPRKLPRPLMVGLASAATLVVLFVTGGLLIFGARQMSNSGSTSGVHTTAASPEDAQTYLYNPTSTPDAQAPQASGKRTQTTAGAIGAAPATAPGPRNVTVNGLVYSYAGPADVTLEAMSTIGDTNTSLATTKAAASRKVYQGLSADTVYLADDSGKPLSFARATRTYLGVTYALTSSDLTAFGQWPALPAQYATPSGADGSPTFTYDGTDSAGVKVYRLATEPATEGIAIAPKTDTAGPAAGDANWTWWQPLR